MAISSLHQVDEYSRSEVMMALDLLHGESRGYWKYHVPDKKFRQAKAVGKINNERATLLFDSGAEVSILDAAFARKVGCYVDNSHELECEGVGKNPYMADGRTRIKITLAGSLVYYFDVWVGPPTGGQDLILGMDFMVPAGIRLDLADGSINLPDEVRIQIAGRRQLYGEKVSQVRLGEHCQLEVGASVEVRKGFIPSSHRKLWVTRGERWVPSLVAGLGKTRYLKITNISDRKLVLQDDAHIGMWLEGGRVPRAPGFVLIGSRRYAEWQNLAFQATTDQQPEEEPDTRPAGPMVDRPQYVTPTKIWSRDSGASKVAVAQITESRPVETKSRTNAPGINGAHEEGNPIATEMSSDRMEERSDGMPIGRAPMIEPKTPPTTKSEIPDDDEVCYHEGGDLFAEDVEKQMAVLPEVATTTDEVTIEDIQVGDPDFNTPEEIDRLRQIIWRRRHLLIGKGNALPPAAVGAVCDIDVGGATPVAQRVRRVAPQFREKLSDLIKSLLSAEMIVPSTSPWASPIVIIIKKNGVDIRLCIDYRLVNGLTRLMVYPMPMINDLLEDLDKVLWYCSLDMASGFWVVSMTERARKISAFVTPFGLFEWTRMPFGLKNAPQIYQRLIDNALYGHLRISASHDLSTPIDVFEAGEPEPELKPSVLGRRSYIDDILVTATTWDTLCENVERLLDACERWNLSISVVKSFWGQRKVGYLGHQVSADGLEAHPKDLEALSNLPFPLTLRSMQSFLGSLNYYSRFIEDFAIYAAVLYELREADFHEIGRLERVNPGRQMTGGDEPQIPDADRWTRAKIAFTMLKAKIVSTPILKHFDPDRTPVIVVYASQWAISAALVQEHDGVYWPVTFTSRTLKSNELNYGIVDKEVLALLRMLDVNYTLLTTRSILVLSRHSTLAWLVNSAGFQGRLGNWAALLSEWTLEIRKCAKGEDEILGAIAASITPRAEVDEALIAIAPVKQPRQTILMPPPTVEADENLLVASFDGSARVKRSGGAYSAIIWKLPEWTILSAASEYMPDLTVNEAEYRGLLLCFDLLSTLDRGRIVICGDSNLVIRQMRGEIACKAPGLLLLRQKAMERLRSWPKHEFLHMKRDWNQSADKLASTALQREEGTVITSEGDRQDLATLNRLDELLKPKDDDSIVQVSAVTRSTRRRRLPPETLQETIIQRMRSKRVVQAQNEEKWITDLKAYLKGDVGSLTAKEAKSCAKIADDYELDESDLLLYCPSSMTQDEDRDEIAKLVVPETLQQDFLHHYHASLEGGHQGIGRTYRRIRSHFHWRGLYRSVQRYVGECTDCETGKGRPFVRGESPGNLQATYPFQIVAMDHIPSLPKSFKGNTELLIWVDLFSGYVIAKASASRTAQTIADNYEECVFRRFGASEAIRHDREPGFMSDFFRAFSRIVGQKQRATMAYRPQANGTAERMVQTLTRALKMYVADVNQQDWDEYAERLTFAINTAHDRVRGDTPFYLIHGWDPRSTLEAALPVGSTRRRDREPRRWRFHMQSQYRRAREQVNERLREAIQSRADEHNQNVRSQEIEAGARVWLYLDRVKEGYARKLAHMWHGPFRVVEMIGNHAARLETAGTEYRLFPIVHVSKLKLVRSFPDRPTLALTVVEGDRFDFDEAILPEDSWERSLGEDEYEVDKIVDVRSGRRTRYGRVHREFQVYWKGYEDPSWVDEADLNCGALLREYEREVTNRNRFGVMQSHEAEEEGS